MDLLRRVPPRVRGLLLLLTATAFAGIELWDILGALAVGIDFEPLRNAAHSVLHGESVYLDPAFVYPPTAAVLLLPTAYGNLAFAFGFWVLACVGAVALGGVVICRAAEPGHRLYFAGLALLGLLGSVVAHRSLFLGNMSEMLVPFAAGLLLAFRRGRWTLGCALLAASLLIKPLLAPLLLVPLLHRQWGALLRTMLPAGLILLASMAVVPGGWHFPAVLRYCLAGTNLHGLNAVNNLSLRGWAEGQHAPAIAGVVASILVGLLVIVRVAAALRGGARPSPVWLGTFVLLGVFLTGGISEVHFLLVPIAGALLHLTGQQHQGRQHQGRQHQGRQHQGRRVWPALLPGLALLGLPSAYPALLVGPHNDAQSWLVAGELLLLLGFAAIRSGPDIPAGAAADAGAATAAAAGAAAGAGPAEPAVLATTDA